MRSPENVYADIREIVRNQGVRNIHFFDPLTPPRTLAHLSRESRVRSCRSTGMPK